MISQMSLRAYESEKIGYKASHHNSITYYSSCFQKPAEKMPCNYHAHRCEGREIWLCLVVIQVNGR
jgi:hypothetical protein